MTGSSHQGRHRQRPLRDHPARPGAVGVRLCRRSCPPSPGALRAAGHKQRGPVSRAVHSPPGRQQLHPGFPSGAQVRDVLVIPSLNSAPQHPVCWPQLPGLLSPAPVTGPCDLLPAAQAPLLQDGQQPPGWPRRGVQEEQLCPGGEGVFTSGAWGHALPQLPTPQAAPCWGSRGAC